MPKVNRHLVVMHGFSLVEMLVALVFTGLLMAGMGQVFKSSLTSFYTSGETLSSARRNRMTIDILYDDLNSTGMYLTSLTAPPLNVTPGNPAFYILPNMQVAGAEAGETADELYCYLDQPLGFEGSISAAGNSASMVIATGGTPSAADSTFVIECGDPSYAKQVKAGHFFITKDSWETLYVGSVDGVSGSAVTVTASGSPGAGITGMGSMGTPSRFQHILNSRILFYAPAQMLRYSVKMKNLDPQVPAGVPCLIRDQGNYSSNGFVADPALESIITENLSLKRDVAAEKPDDWPDWKKAPPGFKVYLSVDSGQNWAGYPKFDPAGTGLSDWSNVTTGIRAELDTQLAAAGRIDYKTTRYTAVIGNEHWFRKIPTLVRVDLKTRTSTQRVEYSPKPNQTVPVATYRNLTQSLVVVPRHFGLPIN